MEEAIEFVLRRLKYEHIFFSKNGAIRRNLVHSRAHFSLHSFAVRGYFFQNVAFADKSENKEKEEP